MGVVGGYLARKAVTAVDGLEPPRLAPPRPPTAAERTDDVRYRTRAAVARNVWPLRQRHAGRLRPVPRGREGLREKLAGLWIILVDGVQSVNRVADIDEPLSSTAMP